jgi:glycosyltransferase involved in cell wall biosynthesis
MGKDQVSSGTITLALAYGKAIISTPTIFAKETLDHKRGLYCEFANATSIANCVKRILDDLDLRHELETNATKYGQSIGWTRVADKYGDVFRSARRVGRTPSETAILVK